MQCSGALNTLVAEWGYSGNSTQSVKRIDTRPQFSQEEPESIIIHKKILCDFLHWANGYPIPKLSPTKTGDIEKKNKECPLLTIHH